MMDNKHELGDVAQVEFVAIPGHQPVEGKIDTGATTSSLDSSWYEADTEKGTVTFTSRLFDDRKITMDLQGSQSVQTADHGVVVRPVIKLDVKIDGVLVKGALFNLNDRKDMAPILIGQNILKAGQFVINPAKNQSDEPEAEDTVVPVDKQPLPKTESKERAIEQALALLREHNISFDDIIKHLRTQIVESIK